MNPVFSLDFKKETLSEAELLKLNLMWKRCAARIIKSTTLAGSGHPGGSLSSLHFLLMLYASHNITPAIAQSEQRDRIIISHGHISPGVYSVLAEYGFLDEELMITEFRMAGSNFAGHVETGVLGVEWGSGNLGQGLSIGCGSALAAKIKNLSYHTIVCMGDGEQQKGQISEARRFAVKYELDHLVGLIDLNHLQIGGDTRKIMPQNIANNYLSDGWNVIEVTDGNNFEQIYQAFRKVSQKKVDNLKHPTVILANTVMGYGVPLMIDGSSFHGKSADYEQALECFSQIGSTQEKNELDRLIKKRKNHKPKPSQHNLSILPYPKNIEIGKPIEYSIDEKTDCRTGYGNALKSLAELNNKNGIQIIGISCDLEDSVKMGGFHKVSPDGFFECGIQEHHAASLSGQLSREGLVTFFSTFAMFGCAEVYNQQRLNDINGSNIKLVCTHTGVDVGEDGPTHQSIDYIALIGSLFHFSLFFPADANQTDRIIRYIATHHGNHAVFMGRSKLPTISHENEKNVFYNADYQFVPGKADIIREGKNGYIITFGYMVSVALSVVKNLKERHGISIGVVNMASLKPLDEKIIIECAKSGAIFTLEDHNVHTGLGTLTASVLAENRLNPVFYKLGMKDYNSSGKPSDLYQRMGLDTETITQTILNSL